MVGLLEANAGALGVTADAVHLRNTITRTVTQLENETASLTVTPERTGNLLTVAVDVVNLAGHKLPSGLPSRRCWLHVVVTDENNNTIFESGKPTGDGRIEGNDAEDDDPTTWEPHYTVITLPEEVQIYEPIMRTFEGGVTYTLLRAYEYAKDNRLLPAGFNKATAGPDIAVHGVPSSDDNFQGGSDQIVYEIGIAGLTGNLHVTAELLYQTLSHPFVADLAKADPGPRPALVERFLGMYDPAANKEEVLAVATETVTVP